MPLKKKAKQKIIFKTTHIDVIFENFKIISRVLNRVLEFKKKSTASMLRDRK